MMAVARLVALAILSLAAAHAVDVRTLQPQGYVSDFAQVLDPVAHKDLERYAARLERATGVQMALVTVDTLGGEPIEDAANDLFRRWGIGQKGADEGLLLLLAIRDRASRLEVGRGLEPYITDGTAGSLLRAMRPALRENRYADALGTAAHELGQRIASAKGVAIPETEAPRRRVRPQEGGDIPFPLIIGGMLLLFWLLGMGGGGGRRGRGGGAGHLLAGMLLGSMMRGRSPYGGFGGGGFGGYDSGDSFGGFGGGDSGGGGASSNW